MWSVTSPISPQPTCYTNEAFTEPGDYTHTIPTPGTSWNTATISTNTRKQKDAIFTNHRSTIRKRRREPWSWRLLVFSLFVCFCCHLPGVILGTLSTITNVLGYVDHKVKDYKRSVKKRQLSCCCATVGFILGLLMCILVVALSIWYSPLKLLVRDFLSFVWKQKSTSSS